MFWWGFDILVTFWSFRYFVDILELQVFCWHFLTPLFWWLWLMLVSEFRWKTTMLVTKWSHQPKIRLETSSIIFVDSDADDSFKILMAESWCWWLFQCDKLVTNILNLSPTHLSNYHNLFTTQNGFDSRKSITDSFIFSSIIKFAILKVLKYQLWCLAIVIS